MDIFIACICRNELSRLVVSGEASAEDLAEAWTNLFYEYCDMAEALETKHRVRLTAEINLERSRIVIVTNWVKYLAVQPSEEIANALRLLDFDYELDPSNPDQYTADIARLHSDLSIARLRLRIKEAELEAILERQSTTDTVDEKYFSTIFFRINNYAKREAVNGQTTVENYCAALRDFVAAMDLKKQASNG